MHGHIIFITLMSFCYLQTSHAADKGYNDDCTAGTDTCTAPGTECQTEGTETKCFCKTGEHWVDNQGNTACVCDADGHWVGNTDGTACVCDASNFWQLDTTMCKCAPTYVLDVSICRGTIDSTVCAVSGSECSTTSDSYCDADELKCKCPAIATAGTNTCTYKACTSSDTCTALDSNSECSTTGTNDKCRCKTGHAIGSDGKCTADPSPDSDAGGVGASMAMLLVCFLTTLF